MTALPSPSFQCEFDTDSENPNALLTISNTSIQILIRLERTGIRDLTALLSRNLGGLNLGQCCGQPVFWAANQGDFVYIMIGDHDLRHIRISLDREVAAHLRQALQ